MQKSDKLKNQPGISDINAQFSKKICEAIRLSGKKVHEIQAALGVSEKTLYNWTRGLHLPDIAELTKLAEITGKPASFFYNAVEEDSQEREKTTENEKPAARSADSVTRLMGIIEHQQRQIDHHLSIMETLSTALKTALDSESPVGGEIEEARRR